MNLMMYKMTDGVQPCYLWWYRCTYYVQLTYKPFTI